MVNIEAAVRHLTDASQAPFIIAEMSGNHDGSLDRALELVREAAAAGAHALKLQTFTPDSMTLEISGDPAFMANPNSAWKGASLYELYARAQTPWEWHKPIFDLCADLGLVGFSAPFDAAAVDFLEGLDVPFYKIASFENVDISLIEKVARTGKPVIISLGMATLAEIDDAVHAARDNGCSELVLLKCTSTYPASPSDINLSAIPHLRDMFQCTIGLSDHTLGIGVSLAATALGAHVIERHLTLDRDDGAVDSSFSLQPAEMAQLVREAQDVRVAIGSPLFGSQGGDAKAREKRRSLYVIKDLCAGERLTQENVKAIRPGFGLSPKHYSAVIGMTVTRDVRRGTPVGWDLVK